MDGNQGLHSYLSTGGDRVLETVRRGSHFAAKETMINVKVVAPRGCEFPLPVGDSQHHFANCFNFAIAVGIVRRRLDMVNSNACVLAGVGPPRRDSIRLVAVRVGVTYMSVREVVT